MTPNTTAQEKPGKKARHRSPNYPAIGLRSAVEKINIIYKADGLAPSLRDAALKHIGFEKAHGEAHRVLSALKSFGLIEEANERVKLTQRGVNIVARQDGDEQRGQAILDAVIGPDIYRELLMQYQDSGLPSDTALRSELCAVKRFNPNAVDDFISEFRDTLEFAGLSDLAVLGLDVDALDANAMNAAEEAAVGQSSQGKSRLPAGAVGIPPVQPQTKLRDAAATLLSQALVVSIPRNFRVDVNVRGDELRREDLAKIKSQFNRWIEGLEEAFEE